ncbi:MAG: hypothetical protein ABIP82_03075 [Nitrospirales bacterium]
MGQIPNGERIIVIFSQKVQHLAILRPLAHLAEGHPGLSAFSCCYAEQYASGIHSPQWHARQCVVGLPPVRHSQQV